MVSNKTQWKLHTFSHYPQYKGTLQHLYIHAHPTLKLPRPQIRLHLCSISNWSTLPFIYSESKFSRFLSAPNSLFPPNQFPPGGLHMWSIDIETHNFDRSALTCQYPTKTSLLLPPLLPHTHTQLPPTHPPTLIPGFCHDQWDLYGWLRAAALIQSCVLRYYGVRCLQGVGGGGGGGVGDLHAGNSGLEYQQTGQPPPIPYTPTSP